MKLRCVGPGRGRFIGLIAFASCALLMASQCAAATLHVVLAVDRKAERVGNDLHANPLFFALYGGVPEESRKIYEVDPEQMSEAAILAEVRAVEVQPDDALMFVYVGHGAYDTRLGTYMRPSASTGQTLSATQMVQELKAKRPRLAVVVFDCCNREKAPASRIVAAPGVGPPPTRPNAQFDALFFKPAGTVLVVSSSPGQYALVRAQRDDDLRSGRNVPASGPLFLNAFGKILQNDADSRPTWSQFLAKCQAQLDADFATVVGPQRLVTLDDGTAVRQDRQTIQLRFFR